MPRPRLGKIDGSHIRGFLLGFVLGAAFMASPALGITLAAGAVLFLAASLSR